MLKKLLAGILAITITFSSVGLPETVSAETVKPQEVAETTEGVSTNNEMSIEGTNSFGNLLTDSLSEKMEEQQENAGYNIFSAEVIDTEVVIDFESTSDATLVAAIYDEAGTKLLASGSLEVFQGETQAVVSIDTKSMPKYFYLRCFLVDSETLRPLCTSYESPNYTQEMQEFFAKTTEDFDAEKVLNLDEDNTNNFAVYSDTTKIIPKRDGSNVVVTADDATDTYVIEYADESITSLQTEDIFAYEYEEGNILIVKVADISLNTANLDNTIATITGAQTSMEDVFDYVKIDSEAGIDEAEVDASNLEEGVTYNGLVDYEEDGIQTYAIEGGSGSQSLAASYDFIDKKIGSDNLYVKLSGGVELKIETSVEFYLSLSYQYLSLKLEYYDQVDITIEGKAKGALPLGIYKFSPVPGVCIKLTPSFIIDAEMKISINGTLYGRVGFSVSSDVGVTNLTSTPEFAPSKSGLETEGTIFVGISLEPEIKILSDKVAKAGMKAQLGVEVKATMTKPLEMVTWMRHDCKTCIDGDVNGKIEISFEVQLLNTDKWKFTKKAGWTVKVMDFYYSFDHEEFGFTPCPHIGYQVTVTVKDDQNAAIADAVVDTVEYSEDTQNITDKDGTVSFYLPNGTYNIMAIKNGYTGAAKQITIKNTAKSFEIQLEKEISARQIALGENTSGAITEDGSLYMWGYNWNGQLGNGTTANSLNPIKILDNVKSVSIGYNHSGAITEDGSLYMWGGNLSGQLGNGTQEWSLNPTKILDNVKSVSLGYNYSGAITEDGNLYMWGSNLYGALGNGTTANSLNPIKILDNVKSVSLDNYHSGAITEDGSLYMWGKNNYGQLGNGTTEDSSIPVKILENVKSVSSDLHSGAITEDGSLYMWGYNHFGQLGNGTTVNSSRPIKILENVKSVSNGSAYSGAIMEDGSLYMWGYNYYGQLGNGTRETSLIPMKVKLPKVSTFSLAGMDNTNTVKGFNIAEEEEVMMTNPSVTEDATNSALKTATFTGLSANEIYNFYAVKSKEKEEILSSDNLLYIRQAVSDDQGNLSITYEMKEDYSSPEIFLVESSRKDIKTAKVIILDLIYNKKSQIVNPTVTYNGTLLTEGVDYELTGDYGKTDIGTYTLTIQGIGNYIGSISAEYKIYCEHQYDSGKVTKEANCKENGICTYTCQICKETKEQSMSSTVHKYDGGKVTVKATVGQNGKFVKTCVYCGDENASVIYAIKGAEISEETYTYNGKVKTPKVVVKDTNGTVLKDTDYAVTYAKGRKNVGKYTVTIELKGNYSGTIKKTFTIIPKSVSLTSLKAEKKALLVKWKKQKKQTTGYEIAYSTSKKFTKKTTKTITLKSNEKTSGTISKLKAKKKYYVRIRTFKTAKVNGKSTKIYSKWSGAKSMKTK